MCGPGLVRRSRAARTRRTPHPPRAGLTTRPTPGGNRRILYMGGRPRTFTLPERREIKKIAKSKPTEHDLPFSTWSLSKLADFPVAEG